MGIRNLGDESVQSKLFGFSEATRGILQTLLGFAFLGIMGAATSTVFGFKAMLIVGAVTVSYTHLDVYKRQEMGSTIIFIWPRPLFILI